MIAGDEVVVIRDTVDVTEMAQDKLTLVGAGEFGRVLRTDGYCIVVVIDGEPKSRTVTIARRDVEDMSTYTVRRAMRR